MLMDHVRVYGAANTSECLEYTFTDDFYGWKKIVIPTAQTSEILCDSCATALPSNTVRLAPARLLLKTSEVLSEPYLLVG
jgi:hypothetical protein